MSFKAGDKVGDYEVLSLLGAGGMGRVYKVRNVLSNRLEAMKVLLPGSLGTADQDERFLREIRVQASLDHPNIAALRTALRVDNQIVMIMELVEGSTLQSMLQRGPLSPKTAVGYVCQALGALSYAHGHGVIHRDIKPGNIMLTSDGIIKLTDFGIAKAEVDRSLTVTGATMGSIYYMSPEQVKGSVALDARSDLYSLGVTLYESVTGARPFQGENDYSILTAHLNDAPAPVPGVPAELNQAILKALAKDPAGRFQSAAEFQKALESIQGLPEEAAAPKAVAVAGAKTPAASAGTTTSQPATRSTGSQTSASGSLEMAYVLFMDIVAYSTMPMDLQTERITNLVNIVRDTAEFRRSQEADQLISLPTGDGMALVFFQNPIAPVQCATQVSKVLRSHPDIKLRMGIHTGPVYRLPDINTNRNVAGGGINMAQRVMDCGDAGHILVSKTVADVLGQLSEWSSHFHDLGEAEVKHGVKVHIVNFYTDEVGNPEIPQKIRKTITVQAQVEQTGAHAMTAPIAIPTAAPRKNTYLIAGGGVLAVVILAVAATQFSKKPEGGQDKNPPSSSAAQSPGQPSIPVPPPPPGNAASAVPPGGLPPQSAGAASASTQAVVAKQSAAVRQGATTLSVPAAAQTTPAAAAPASAPAPAAQSAQSAADKAQLQELRERMVMLAGRVGGLRGSLDNLQRQQAASGLSLRGDMAAARESMEYLMGEAKSSMTAGDPEATKRNLDLAEKQVEKLEKFLGR